MAIADPAGIEGDLDRFRMPGRVRTDHLVMRGVCGTASIPGDGAADALDMLEYALDAPEAAAGEDGNLRSRRWVRRLVERRRRERARALGGRWEALQRDAGAKQQRRKNQRQAEQG